MRIYLDSNVFRDLKKSENKALYDLILTDKERNYYYYSEAHIQDLVQDSTDMKWLDIDFMETIVGDNCWHYDKGIQLRFRTPCAFYGDYTWGEGTDLMTSDEAIYRIMREMFRAIPIDFKSLLQGNELPADFPEDMKVLLLEPATMLDFMDAMLDMTENLSAEQPRFRRLLQYLHRSFGMNTTLYEKLGIKGYNGGTFTDWEAFAQSFRDLIYEKNREKDIYNQFIDMQYALDIYGIVKGKPKKQKFISLLNDGKHAFYAGHAHLLVTSDDDMIAKTKIIYKILGIETEVITPTELALHLRQNALTDDSAKTLFEQFDRAAELPIIYEKYDLDEMVVKKDLPAWYLGQFNTLTCASARGYTYYYFSQQFSNMLSRTLTVEVERIVNRLVEHFGTDELGRAKLDRKEVENLDWSGREWRVGDMGVLFQIKQGIMISIFRAALPNEKR